MRVRWPHTPLLRTNTTPVGEIGSDSTSLDGSGVAAPDEEPTSKRMTGTYSSVALVRDGAKETYGPIRSRFENHGLPIREIDQTFETLGWRNAQHRHRHRP